MKMVCALVRRSGDYSIRQKSERGVGFWYKRRVLRGQSNQEGEN